MDSPSLDVTVARDQVLKAALRCLSARMADGHAMADAEAEYAYEQLAVAARDLAVATEALPADGQPVGWQPQEHEGFPGGQAEPSGPGGSVKFRAHGTKAECAEAVKRLHGIFAVVSVSPPYPGRGSSRLVRMYAEVRL